MITLKELVDTLPQQGGVRLQHAGFSFLSIPGNKRVHIFDLCKGQTGSTYTSLAHKGKHAAYIGTDWRMAGCADCSTKVAPQIAKNRVSASVLGNGGC